MYVPDRVWYLLWPPVRHRCGHTWTSCGRSATALPSITPLLHNPPPILPTSTTVSNIIPLPINYRSTTSSLLPFIHPSTSSYLLSLSLPTPSSSLLLLSFASISLFPSFSCYCSHPSSNHPSTANSLLSSLHSIYNPSFDPPLFLLLSSLHFLIPHSILHYSSSTIPPPLLSPLPCPSFNPPFSLKSLLPQPPLQGIIPFVRPIIQPLIVSQCIIPSLSSLSLGTHHSVKLYHLGKLVDHTAQKMSYTIWNYLI